MFAVIRTGGKQYRVAANDTITVGRIEAEQGSKLDITDVIMHGKEDKVTVGAPVVENFAVSVEIVEHVRGPKVIAFKKRRRQDSQRKRGHRQDHTVIRVLAIGGEGAEPKKKATRAKAASKKEAPAETAAEA
jgi:large subunit ribosomal protein L21